jgi:hypothetical protein
LEDYLEAVKLEAEDRKGGAMDAENLLIGLLVILGMKRVEYDMVCSEMEAWLGV